MDLTQHYENYYWKEGIPYGLKRATAQTLISYKIPMDPYRRRISIEKYHKDQLEMVIYDSSLLNFRHLKPAEQLAWQKVPHSETPEKTVCLIRDQDDRALFYETYFFEQNLCRRCEVVSSHGILLSIQKMLYTKLGDHINGVILYDSYHHPVMYKTYEANEDTGEFTELKEEVWDMQNKNLPIFKTI